MGIFRRKLTPEEYGAKVRAQRDAGRVARMVRDVESEAEQIVKRELAQHARAELLAAEVSRLRALVGLPDPAPVVAPAPVPMVAEIVTPAPAPVKVPKVPKARTIAPKVSPAPVEAPEPPAPAPEDVAQAAPVAASPAIASGAKVSPPRTRKTRTVAAKVAKPEPVTVPLPVTVAEPCGVQTVWQPKKGGKCEALGIKFK